MKKLFLCLVLCAAVFAGCDLFTGTTTTVYGTVVDKQTGEPLADISVALTIFGGFGPATAEASTVTDAHGEFHLSTDFDKSNTMDLYVNRSAIGTIGLYNPEYSTYQEVVHKGRVTKRRIKL